MHNECILVLSFTPALVMRVNGEVELSDAVILAKAVGQSLGTDLSVQGRSNADVYYDGNLDGSDIRILLSLIAGFYKQSQMPVEP
mgnify:CR=1 FL=1